MVVGKSAESELIRRMSSIDSQTRMPPEGPALSASEIAAIASWIDGGALSPTNETPEIHPRDHWAYQLPRRSVLPATSPWSRNPIDALIEEQQRSHRVSPLEEIEGASLLRRVNIDLTGLPPTRDELHHFEHQTPPDRFDRLVDRLLASPAYGERWGRHWMDVWRYSDWYGRRSVPDVMNSYPQIWRWRDWIVDSLNADRPYDEMVVAMLAADEATPGDDREVVATGFLVRNWFKWNYENWMKDNVEHTAKAFLGITMNCCHCHDHKYDPMTQEEYFRFRAFFEPLELRQDRVAGLPDPGPFQKYEYSKAYGPIEAGLIRVFDEKPEALTYMYVKGDSRNRMVDKPPVIPGVPASLGGTQAFQVTPISLPPQAYYPGLHDFIRDEERAKRWKEIASAEADLAKSHEQEKTLQAKWIELDRTSPGASDAIAETDSLLSEAMAESRYQKARLDQAKVDLHSLEARISADDARFLSQGDPHVSSSLAFGEEKQLAYRTQITLQAKAERDWLIASRQARADAKNQPALDAAKQKLTEIEDSLEAARVQLQTTGNSYTPLSPIYPNHSSGRRLALARWIASEKNPLTARVAANHLWSKHFGRALVDTPANFGRSGHSPSHPALLDWLAAELMEEGWHTKHLHRAMVTSATYRLQSKIPPADHPNVAVDRDNYWYWRANTRRMEAEVVRDAVLACANELDQAMGGQEIDSALGLTTRRRSLYFASHGEGKMLFLETFDAPDVCDGYERSTSIRPQQALALANSELTLAQSRQLSEELWSSASNESNEERRQKFIRSAFEQILSRPALPAEELVADRFLNERERRPVEGGDAGVRARSALIHALFNHHDFVTVR